ncbi:TolC family protein [Fulvivirga sedimenti]|uniref:TolC family protein n=1 Tax=Fulvivirga sedimenti TaxID=2879465 RepID=A0A9X1HN25_9BACT|nr:TolC family protein [Fulvivirga sedimenti]MCA6075178.1 TolC family protein [Fulvivirga sedimenti]MCA6076355.1 TolC family protein [Fulvivirga sedimenti]MCA6077483.1 TolC family protein [Fulvivirga sedimenti]
MKMRTLFGILLSFLASAVYAQDTLQFLHLSDAVTIALENNISLRQESNRLDIFQSDKSSSYAQMAPTVAITGNYGRNDGNSFNQQEGRVVNGQLDFMNGSVNMNMPLFNGFNRLKQTKQASSALESQAHLVTRTRQQVIRDVSNQYLRCLLDKQLVLIAQENLVNQQEVYRQMSELVNAGSRAEVDLVNQRYQLKNSELNVLQAEIKLRNSKATLSQLLQLDPSLTFDVVDPTWELSDFAFEKYQRDSLYEIALEQRRDLLQVRASEESARYGLGAQRGRYYPQLSAFFNYGSAFNQIVGTPDSVSRDFNQQFFNDNRYNTYGLAISIPIFQGLQNRNQVVRARVNYQNAQLETRQLENTAKLEVLNAHQNLQDALTNFEVTQVQLEAAELNLQLQEERYRLQASSFVEYTQANADYVAAKGAHAQAKYVLLFQDILLQFTLGTLDTDDIPAN